MHDYSLLLLRVCIGGIFLWFGITAILDPAGQMHWLADWVVNLPVVGSSTFILIFGVIEAIIGVSLVLGILVRWTALIAAMLLLGIVINLGFNEVMLRDLGLMAACIVLSTTTHHRCAIWD